MTSRNVEQMVVSVDELKPANLLDSAAVGVVTAPEVLSGSMSVEGLLLARVVAFSEGLPVLVYALRETTLCSLAYALACVLDPVADVGCQVCIAFDRQDSRKPVVIGKMNEEIFPKGGLQLTSDSEIVLRCGKSSIQLKADGTVSIRGTNVATRATQTNRIRGGNVQIN